MSKLNFGEFENPTRLSALLREGERDEKDGAARELILRRAATAEDIEYMLKNMKELQIENAAALVAMDKGVHSLSDMERNDVLRALHSERYAKNPQVHGALKQEVRRRLRKDLGSENGELSGVAGMLERDPDTRAMTLKTLSESDAAIIAGFHHGPLTLTVNELSESVVRKLQEHRGEIKIPTGMQYSTLKDVKTGTEEYDKERSERAHVSAPKRDVYKVQRVTSPPHSLVTPETLELLKRLGLPKEQNSEMRSRAYGSNGTARTMEYYRIGTI